MKPLQSILFRSIALSCLALTVSAPQAQSQDSLEEATAALTQAEQQYETRHFSEALALARRAVELRETALGPDHLDTAAALHQMGRASYQLDDLPNAEAAYTRALTIRRARLGPEHADTRRTMSGLADVFTDAQRFAAAESLLRKVIALDRKVSDQGRESARHLRALGRLYLYKQDYARAAEHFARALRIRQRVLGPEHPETAGSLTDLGNAYDELGRFEQALQYTRRALQVREKALGPNHPVTAISIRRLAELYSQRGEYGAAEELLTRALEISTRTLGETHSDTIYALTSLGGLYVRTGTYAQAESLLQRSLTLADANLGDEHPTTSAALNYLSGLYAKLNMHAAAEPLLQRALALSEKLNGRDSRITAGVADNLAARYLLDNEIDKAFPLQQRALAIFEAGKDPNNLETAIALNNRGELYSLIGDYSQAESVHRRALAIREQWLGAVHPATIATYNSLGVVKWRLGQPAAALQYFRSAQASSAILSERLLRWGSENRKQELLSILKDDLDTRVTFSLAAAGSDSAALGLLDVLLYKGRVLDSAAQALANLRLSPDTLDGKLLEGLQQVSTELSALTYRGPGNLKPMDYQHRIEALLRKQQQLEAQIASRNERVRQQLVVVTLPAIRRAIPSDAALVELLRYGPFDLRAKTMASQRGATRYAAYVVVPQRAPLAFDLGEAAPIDTVVHELRRSLGNPASTDVQERAAQLSAQIIAPLLPHLRGQRRLLISPDGPLNLIPFAALVDERGRYLVERFDISYLTSGRDLLRFASKPRARTAPRVVANPEYGQAPAVLASEPLSSLQRSIDFDRGGLTFRGLPGTALEARTLQSVLGLTEREVLLGSRATELEIKRLHGPRLLHLATHGFYLGDVGLESKLQAPSKVTDVPASLRENPLLRAGLALAGANARRSGSGEDGILTALEAAQLDLRGTELVVLSACETGIGEVPASEGVYGLRRAMVLAGAQTQVTSLWRVEDTATRELMVAYYKRLLQSQERSAALRATQRALLAQPRFSHPYYWAGFVQIGNWRALPVAAATNRAAPNASQVP